MDKNVEDVNLSIKNVISIVNLMDKNIIDILSKSQYGQKHRGYPL